MATTTAPLELSPVIAGREVATGETYEIRSPYDDSLVAVAEKGLARETGARGLRSIIEEILLEVQFELPSRRDVRKCVVTRDTIEKDTAPTLVTFSGSPAQAGCHRE